MSDTVTILIQRQSEPPPKKPHKSIPTKATPGQITDGKRYWEDRFLFENVPTAEAASKAQGVIEVNGAPDEIYRILIIGPVTRLVCRSRVVVAEVEPEKPPRPFPEEEEEDFEEEEE